jgi:DNA-binding winged helix-turn-helix (wHTH) protein
MNRIVRDHYPISKLPEDLREGLPPDGEARVVIETKPPRRGYSLAELLEIKKSIKPATDDPVERIRKLRDEWD